MNDPSDAEYEDDCRALDSALGKVLEEDEGLDDSDPREHLATAELARTFYIKHRAQHRARLEADGIDVTASLRGLAEQARVYGGAVEAEDKAMDAYLQARANQADAAAQLTGHEFKILRYIESMFEADWAAIPPEHQKELRAALGNVRNAMPAYLAALPIEKRRQLEGLE